MLQFPRLSRKPALRTRESTIDPTIRDTFENGMEATRPRFTRRRRQWDVTIDALTPADKLALDAFVENQAIYGAVDFAFPDPTDTQHGSIWHVRFSTLPAYSDAGNIEGEWRKSCTFQLREL